MGAELPASGRFFCNFWEKKRLFLCDLITFLTLSEPFERTKFLMFENKLKKSLSSLQVKSKTRLKSCILGLNFVTWPGQGNQGTLLSATFLALNNALEDLPLKIFVLS